jgi:hypothetical protein
MFGGSQSASVSMSANMNPIVEGVERLVESDTYENPPNDQLSFLGGAGNMPTPTQIGPDANAYPFTLKPPPGLGQPAHLHSMASRNMNIQENSPYRAQTQFSDMESSFPSSLMPSQLSSMPPHVGQGWERPATGRRAFDAFGVPSQPMSTGATDASWANNAFIGSSLSSGPDPHSSGLRGNRKPVTQISGIGQTPPCGQGG